MNRRTFQRSIGHASLALAGSLASVLSLVSVLSLATPAWAQKAPWPEHPIRVIVPFAPGSTPDLAARIICERVTRTIGQPLIVDNRAGAGGNVGTNTVAKAAPDGYTIGFSIGGPLVNNTVLYRTMPYDPFKDLVPITQVVDQPSVLVVSPDLKVNDARDLFAALKTNPGKYNYASIGVGSVSQLSVELIKQRTGTFIVHVPYNSSPAAVQAVMTGDAQIASLAPAAVIAQIKAGKLRAIAVTTATRSRDLPEVPTFKEIGMPEVQASAWIGVIAPAATPAPIVDRLNREMVAAVHDPEVAARLRAQFMEPVGSSQAEFSAFLQDELRRWTPVIRRSGVTID